MTSTRPAAPGLFLTACLLGLVGVAAGAFGAHALEGSVTPQRLATFKTGVTYQLAHAPVLLFLAYHARGPRWLLAGRIMAVGTVVFATTLYLLVLLDLPVMGAITPLGGVGMLLGWAILAFAARSG